MITLRKSDDRGYVDHGWLKSHHSFSFADYHDPAQVGWGNLRVLNEVRIGPGTGLGTHGHRDMEIITYVLDGTLVHRNDAGGGAGRVGCPDLIRPGDVQRLTAGTGVRHSEFNPSREATAHVLQIWLLPAECGLPPGCAQKHVDAAARRGRLLLLGAPGGEGGAVCLNAEARFHAGLFDGDEHAELALDPRRPAYVHLARGKLEVNGLPLRGGDAACVQDECRLVFGAGQGAEVLVFELAA